MYVYNRYCLGQWWSIHRSPRQKQLISLVALKPQKSLLNSETTVGVNLEHFQKDDMCTDQLNWMMNLWSLAVTLLTAGDLYIFSLNFDLKSFLSALETEIWNINNENNKIIDPVLPSQYYSLGIGLYIVPFDFCSS